MQLITTKGIHKAIPKGKILLHAGEPCEAIHLVKKGCLKSYVIDTAGKEHILQFAPEDWIMSDLDSLYNQKPSKLYIEAVEASEVIALYWQDFPTDEQMEKELLIEYHKKLRNHMIAANNRLIALLSTTAEERYLAFLDKYPQLDQRLPQKLIAAYIGITPEYLSELRRKQVNR